MRTCTDATLITSRLTVKDWESFPFRRTKLSGLGPKSFATFNNNNQAFTLTDKKAIFFNSLVISINSARQPLLGGFTTVPCFHHLWKWISVLYAGVLNVKRNALMFSKPQLLCFLLCSRFSLDHSTVSSF